MNQPTEMVLGLRSRKFPPADQSKTDPISRWALALQERRGDWKAVVAIAAKNARMAWAVLRRGEDFALPT